MSHSPPGPGPRQRLATSARSSTVGASDEPEIHQQDPNRAKPSDVELRMRPRANRPGCSPRDCATVISGLTISERMRITGASPLDVLRPQIRFPQ